MPLRSGLTDIPIYPELDVAAEKNVELSQRLADLSIRFYVRPRCGYVDPRDPVNPTCRDVRDQWAYVADERLPD